MDWADVQEGDAGGMSALGHALMTTLAPQLRRLWPGCLALTAICLAWVLAYDGKRIFQIGVLALPAVLCLCWPSRHAGWRALQVGFVGTMGLVFITDAAVRGFLLDVYEASPASAMVITAVANTTP